MVSTRDSEYLVGLVHELRSLPNETEWVEFKHNFKHNEEIGEYISALSNGAALHGKPAAYLVWGIEDGTHTIVGTNFVPAVAKQGNESLENWLSHTLIPRMDFRFHECWIESDRVVILEISPASHRPVAFNSDEFIRVGSAKKKLKEHPEKEQALWRVFDRVSFEEGIAVERMSDAEVIRDLDYPVYFDLLTLPSPETNASILDSLQSERLISSCDAGGWNVTNLGAVLLAKNLSDFDQFRRLGRKALRVIQYEGLGRISTKREQEFAEGYAVGFQRIVEYIMTLLPANEVIQESLRRSVPMVPDIAVRELVANALIHQDFNVTGTGPIVEIFDDRIEITNPGRPLVNPDRFVDYPPTSRNEALASLMRRFNICEERGSGIDKVVNAVELFQLPAPLFEARGESTVTVLFAPKPLTAMDKSERIRACLRWVMNLPTNNTSLRARFGLPDERVDTASRLLREAVDSGWVKVRDPDAGSRNREYLPFWTGTLEVDI